MKYLRAAMIFSDSNFGEFESFYLYDCEYSITDFYRRISKEKMLNYLKSGDYERVFESYVQISDDEFEEFNRRVNAASKIQYLKILAKNAE